MSAPRAEREVPGMVKVSVEVRSGTARFRVAVRAEGTDRALRLVAGRYPTGAWRVTLPVEAEGFFAEGRGARAGMVERPEELAA